VKVNSAHKVKSKESKQPEQDTDGDELQVIPAVKTKNGRKGKSPGTVVGEITNPAEEGGKISRLGLIKQRHEAIKREIDQIREDLESEEEE